MKRLTVNVGFITNSSSVVHWFPRAVLEDPEVRAFVEAYEIGGGFLGEEIWNKSACGSFVVSAEQREALRAALNDGEYGGGHAVGGEGEVAVVYGDEYSSVASELCEVLGRACRRMGISDGWSHDYN